MSEFIIECDYDPDDGWIPGEHREEIVRCRDCKHMFDWAYDRPMCKLWAMNDPDNSNASYGNALYPVVKLDGFCAWAERKEGGEC